MEDQQQLIYSLQIQAADDLKTSAKLRRQLQDLVAKLAQAEETIHRQSNIRNIARKLSEKVDRLEGELQEQKVAQEKMEQDMNCEIVRATRSARKEADLRTRQRQKYYELEVLTEEQQNEIEQLQEALKVVRYKRRIDGLRRKDKEDYLRSKYGVDFSDTEDEY